MHRGLAQPVCFLMKANFVVLEDSRGLMTIDDSSDRIFKKHKPGTVVECEVKEFKNYKFFCKWWSMVRFAFNNWDAELKTLETFRKEITILAGHYEVVASLGSNKVKKEAKSIAWDRMEEEDFENLYSNTIDAILKQIPTLAKSREELIAMEREILRYD